jgi:hypothetical protein
MTPEDVRPMTADEHLAEAKKFLEYADKVASHKPEKTALAAMATAHATIALAMRSGRPQEGTG